MIKKFLLLFLLIPTLCFGQGLDADTVLLLHGDLDASSETTKDGSLEIMDATGSHVVTQVGDATLQTSVKQIGSSALSVDGNGDYVYAPDSSSFNIGTSDFVARCWIYYSTAISSAKVIFGHVDTDGNPLFRLYYNGTNLVGDTESGVNYRMTVAATISADTWHFVEWNRTSGVSRMFVDGTQVGSNYTNSYNFTDIPDIFAVGGNGILLSTTQAWNGYIDDFYFSIGEAGNTSNYTAPTEAQTKTAYTKLLLHFDTQDVSGDGGSGTYNIPTFVGDAQIDTAQTKFGEGSYLFDGTGDYITIPDASWMDFGTGDFTINFQIKTSYSAANHYPFTRVVGGATNGDNFRAIVLGAAWGADEGKLRFVLAGGNITSTTVIDDGSWHHIELSRTSGTLYIFVDGALEDSDSISSDITGAAPLLIGVYKTTPSYDYYFNGSLDEFRVQGVGGHTTTFTPPTVAYSVEAVGGDRRIFIISKTQFNKLPTGGYDREYKKWRQNFGWNGIEQQLTNAT